jgi:DNA invertase Pin-like site-specific DNA recombinase
MNVSVTIHLMNLDQPARRRRRAKHITAGVRGYVRCSTDEQRATGLGLRAQEAAIRAECQRRGLPLLGIHRDEGLSAATLDRPGLTAAVDALDRGEGSVLLVSKLDRLSRSVRDCFDLMDRSRRMGWAIVALDLGVDTATPSGEMFAGVASVVSQFERRVISQRTKDALAVKRAQGVRLGRPRVVNDDARARIVELRATGASWRVVAEVMADEGWPTAHGGRWLANTCRRIALAEEDAA